MSADVSYISSRSDRCGARALTASGRELNSWQCFGCATTMTVTSSSWSDVTDRERRTPQRGPRQHPVWGLDELPCWPAKRGCPECYQIKATRHEAKLFA